MTNVIQKSPRPACGTCRTNGFGGILLLAGTLFAAVWMIGAALLPTWFEPSEIPSAVHVFRPASCPACPATILSPRDKIVTYTIDGRIGHGEFVR